MSDHTHKKTIRRNLLKVAYFFLTAIVLASCATMDPAKMNVELKGTDPVPKITTYTQALIDLGLMSKIYDTRALKIQSIPINDNTGSSVPTQGEIPKDITEMVKSTLNSIGGNIVYVPYDPVFMQNQRVTGYSNFQNKLIPDVIVSGGITEFDRGLETREKNTDISSQLTIEGLPDYLPGLDEKVPYPTKGIDFRYGEAGKAGLARITLDFNLLDFQTMAGIPRTNTVNSIEVLKGENGGELGISIFGQAFGRKGKVKKVQGRHAAIRVLVELSMIQIIGRQLILPYWKLLGDQALPDKVVLDSASEVFNSLDAPHRVAFTQQQLFIAGYNNIPINGEFDKNTVLALQDFFRTSATPDILNFNTFIKIWSSIPINDESMKRRRLLNDTVQRLREEQATREKKLREKLTVLKRKQTREANKRDAEEMANPQLQEDVEKLLKALERDKNEELIKLIEEKRGA